MRLTKVMTGRWKCAGSVLHIFLEDFCEDLFKVKMHSDGAIRTLTSDATQGTFDAEAQWTIANMEVQQSLLVASHKPELATSFKLNKNLENLLSSFTSLLGRLCEFYKGPIIRFQYTTKVVPIHTQTEGNALLNDLNDWYGRTVRKWSHERHAEIEVSLLHVRLIALSHCFYAQEYLEALHFQNETFYSIAKGR